MRPAATGSRGGRARHTLGTRGVPGVVPQGEAGPACEVHAVELGGEVGAKDAGKMRAEGKEYVVKDGDVLNFLFNV